MRRSVVSLSVSLDGFIEGPNRSVDWHLVDDEVHREFNGLLRPMSAFINGRTSHEMMAGFWPAADGDPDSSAPMVEFAGIWRDKEKFVYSSTLDRADWNTTIVREIDRDDVLALNAQPGGDMALGGADPACPRLKRLSAIPPPIDVELHNANDCIHCNNMPTVLE